MIITIGRKPFKSSIIDNVGTHGCGGINIEETRVGDADTRSPTSMTALGQNSGWNKHENRVVLAGSANGRFPANVLLSEGATTIMDDQSGISRSPKTYVRNADGFNNGVYSDKKMIGEAAGSVSLNFGDEGGASRYFKVIQ